MDYNKTTWKTGDVISETKLNKIETAIDGIADELTIIENEKLNEKLTVSAYDFANHDLGGIAARITESSGMAISGRIKLPAIASPTGAIAWVRGTAIAQNPINATYEVGITFLIHKDNDVYTGYLGGTESSGYSIDWNKMVCVEDSGSMTLSSATGCTVSGFSGTYTKNGNVVTFSCEMTITPNGTSTDIPLEITCLPYSVNRHTSFNVGYCAAYFRSAANITSPDSTSISARSYGNSKKIGLNMGFVGRTWTVYQANLHTAGAIVISGSYITLE